MKRPSFQFYPGDWLNDAGLRLCSIGARGLWIEMLCLMHQGTNYGFLMVNHAPILPVNLARISGATLTEVEGWLVELEGAGVFSRDDSNCIFSRRMISDEKVRAARAAGGILGGNPALTGGAKGSKKVDNKVNHQPNLKPTPSSSPASSSSSSKKPPKGAPAGFDEFWSAYPKKEAKPTALKAFAKVTAPLELLLSAIAVQKKSEKWAKDGGQYIPMPATWLNGERWNDGVTVAAAELDGDTRAAVEREGIDKGIGPWDNLVETWPDYKARVRSSKSLPHLSLDRLGAMAQKHTGAPA